MGLYNLSQKCLATIAELLKLWECPRTHYHCVEYWCKVAGMPGNQDICGLGWVLKSVQRLLLCFFWEQKGSSKMEEMFGRRGVCWLKVRLGLKRKKLTDTISGSTCHEYFAVGSLIKIKDSDPILEIVYSWLVPLPALNLLLCAHRPNGAWRSMIPTTSTNLSHSGLREVKVPRPMGRG